MRAPRHSSRYSSRAAQEELLAKQAAEAQLPAPLRKSLRKARKETPRGKSGLIEEVREQEAANVASPLPHRPAATDGVEPQALIETTLRITISLAPATRAREHDSVGPLISALAKLLPPPAPDAVRLLAASALRTLVTHDESTRRVYTENRKVSERYQMSVALDLLA